MNSPPFPLKDDASQHGGQSSLDHGSQSSADTVRVISSASSPIRLDAARERLGNDDDLLYRLSEFFLEDAPRLNAGLQNAIAAEDSVEIARFAHALKGLAGHFHADDMYDWANRVEDAAKARDTAGVRAAAAELLQESERVAEALRVEVLQRTDALPD